MLLYFGLMGTKSGKALRVCFTKLSKFQTKRLVLNIPKKKKMFSTSRLLNNVISKGVGSNMSAASEAP